MSQQLIKMFIKTNSDETDYHLSGSDAKIGLTHADNEEDEVASDIKPESSVRNTYKTKDLKVKWSKKPCEICGRLPKESTIQNENIGPINLALQHLNTPLEAFALVFKMDFIELIIELCIFKNFNHSQYMNETVSVRVYLFIKKR